MMTPNAPIYSGIVSGLEFVGYVHNDIFLGRLQECGNADPSKVHEWSLPSIVIETIVADGQEATRIPVGSAKMLARSLGSSLAQELDPTFAADVDWYASGFADRPSRARSELAAPIFSLIIQPDQITLENTVQNVPPTHITSGS